MSSQNSLKVNSINSNYKSDSLLLWGDIKYYGELVIPTSKIKSRYSLKKGKLFDNFQKNEVTNLTLILRKSETNSEDVYISNGLPINTYYEKNGENMDWKLIRYNENGCLDGIFIVANYETKFKNGNGIWKNYYFKENKNPNETTFMLKEEGEVRNNFKFREWKYYNKEGKLDSTKTYNLKDSVDVRFPHCIFNKNEPCY